VIRRPTDREWRSIRDAARREDWEDVAARAERLGMVIVAHHARRAHFDRVSRRAVAAGLLLDRAEDPLRNPDRIEEGERSTHA
jgi:hypothetical protein